MPHVSLALFSKNTCRKEQEELYSIDQSCAMTRIAPGISRKQIEGFKSVVQRLTQTTHHQCPKVVNVW